VVLVDGRAGDLVGPQRRRDADRDEEDEDGAEGERGAVAPQPAPGESPWPETRLLSLVSGLLPGYSPLFRQKRE
jgi:hypothetical protein